MGGGLGGLTVAIALLQAGHDPTVFEQTSELKPVGAGISLWPNGVKVLDLLGLAAKLAALGGRMERMAYADMGGGALCDFSLQPLYDTVGQRAWPLPRAALQDLLIDALGRERIRLGERCIGVSGSCDGAVAHLEGGGTFKADLVIGADGTHSVLREWVVGRPVERRYVGYVNFNGLTAADPEIAPHGSWVTWVGEGKRASVMPAGPELLYAFFDIPMPEGTAGPAVMDELREGFAGWARPVVRLLASMDPARTNRVPIYDLPPVERWYRDRVVLLGDAVHAMAPDLGQGGCQALEDGLVLSRLLTDSTNGGLSVGDALRAYQDERAPRTAEIVRRAAKRAGITHGVVPAETEGWYRELSSETGEGVIAGLVESVVTGPFG